MTIQRITTAILLLFAAGSAAYVLFGGSPAQGGGEAREPAANGQPETPPELVVYYMDMGKDCTTCLHLENYTLEALETGFAEELASGRIAFRRVDVDRPENAHFVGDYGLYTKSVVLVRQEDGRDVRFENLSRIWELVYDKEAYLAYIQGKVRDFLDSPGAAE